LKEDCQLAAGDAALAAVKDLGDPAVRLLGSAGTIGIVAVRATAPEVTMDKAISEHCCSPVLRSRNHIPGS
jgi:hypothetical protein